MMSVASSTTPGMEEKSCRTPSIFTAVIEAPSMEDSNTRRRALPIVVPKPRSNGCAENWPYLSDNVSELLARRFGFWNPFQSISILPPEARLSGLLFPFCANGITSNIIRRSSVPGWGNSHHPVSAMKQRVLSSLRAPWSARREASGCPQNPGPAGPSPFSGCAREQQFPVPETPDKTEYRLGVRPHQYAHGGPIGGPQPARWPGPGDTPRYPAAARA